MLRLLTKRPLGIKIVVAAELVLAYISIGAGMELVRDPSGKVFGLQPLISYMPFNLHDFALVGVWLIVVFGLLPIILAIGLWFGKKWAWLGTPGLGVVVVTWILAEVFLFYSFGFTFFYPLIGGIGVLTIVVSYLPTTREYISH